MEAIRTLSIWVLVYIGLGRSPMGRLEFSSRKTSGRLYCGRLTPEGGAQDTVLSLLNDDGELSLVSGRWFRGGCHRVQANPDVELVGEGRADLFPAVPVDTPEAVDRVARLIGKGTSTGYWIARTLLLWAPIKPVRLDPPMKMTERL